MKFTGLKLIACGTLLLLVSCTLNPAWILDPDPLDWDDKNKCFKDTPQNRAFFFNHYAGLIQREVSGEKSPWPIIWKGILQSLKNGGNVNADLYSNFIIKERRKRGLPEVSIGS